MRIEDFERKKVATEWDMGWFCYKCDGLHSWRSKAFVYNGKPYCQECAQKMCKNNEEQYYARSNNRTV